ncbi:hypothetical protein PG993_014034 [Apiospora rasikravindrae]|uniref:Major facilitator superfamily (MFS) profile domain-containing protein n=1 Tax=Apiospora rasikravindrae TaxID=990691 RepID=A0ABR1RS18_9PEZI
MSSEPNRRPSGSPRRDDADGPRVGAVHVPHFKLLTNTAGVTDEVRKRRYPGAGTPHSPYIVDFLDADPYNPLQMPRWKKYLCTFLVAFATLAVTFISSAYSGAVPSINADFGISQSTSILGVSLFVLGFALGPLIWAPMSEHFGRRPTFFGTYLVLTAFNSACIGANSFATLVVLRFFAGVFGASCLTNAGATIADMFDAKERGPIVGGYLGEAAGWRAVHGLFAGFTGLLWILITLVVPETYAPALLSRRAAKLSDTTQHVYVAKTSLNSNKSLVEQYKIVFSRPWVLLFCEPIVLLISIAMAILYGTLSKIDISPARRLPPPEVRLRIAIPASVAFPVGFFWFAWSDGPENPWIWPLLGTVLFSYGLVVMFLALTNYLIDTYLVFAASVFAGNTVLRSIFAAVFPLFTTPMLQNLGIHWAASVPGFLALLCMPFPLCFYKYGPRIRRKGKYATQAEEILLQLRSSINTPPTNQVSDNSQV